MFTIPMTFAAVYPLCLLWAACNDVATMTIPNRLNIILAAAAIPALLLAQLTLGGWGVHIGLAAAGLVVGMTLFALRLVGGGDAKLIAAASIWFDFHGWVGMLTYTALAGGALALGLVVMRKFFWTLGPKLPLWLGRHFDPKGEIPYGIAICAGGLLAIPQGDLWQKLVLPLAG